MKLEDIFILTILLETLKHLRNFRRHERVLNPVPLISSPSTHHSATIPPSQIKRRLGILTLTDGKTALYGIKIIAKCSLLKKTLWIWQEIWNIYFKIENIRLCLISNSLLVEFATAAFRKPSFPLTFHKIVYIIFWLGPFVLQNGYFFPKYLDVLICFAYFPKQ